MNLLVLNQSNMLLSYMSRLKYPLIDNTLVNTKHENVTLAHPLTVRAHVALSL